MEDTSGFYKLEDDNWQYAPNFVYAPNYELVRENKDSYTYPVEGWEWFDTEQEAYEFFQIEWYPEIYTMGLSKPLLNETNNIQNNG